MTTFQITEVYATRTRKIGTRKSLDAAKKLAERVAAPTVEPLQTREGGLIYEAGNGTTVHVEPT